MNHGFKLHPDGTLEITMPKGKKVGRVLVCEEGSRDGALYYRDGDVPDINVGDMISRQSAIDAFMGEPPDLHYPAWYAEVLKGLPFAEPEPILDKIRSEIEEVYINLTYEENRSRRASWGLRRALEIIDKYKSKSDIEELPSVQPERKKGKWIEGRDKRFVKCSKCGMETTKNSLKGIALFGKNEPNFCPNCGSYNGGNNVGKSKQYNHR